jgi:hypothetical protein
MALALTKPAALKAEPKAVSAHPAYGQARTGDTDSPSFLFRIDESKGDGKGYDRLVVDVNGNGDLSDDPVLAPLVLTGQPKYPEGYELANFGPFQAPADKAIGGKRPTCYAQMIFYRKGLAAATTATATPATPARTYVGSIRFYSGWYLETTVTVAGAKQKLGLVDGNVNFRLGDTGGVRTVRVASTNQENWYFTGGDNWLRDVDNSGKFENKPFGAEYQAFGSIMYVAGTPCRVAVKPDFKAVTVEPWPGPLGELALQPNGAQVRAVTLACEEPAGQWQLFHAPVVNGKVRVPPGKYRLYMCELAGTAADKQPLAAAGYQRQVTELVTVAANQTVTLTAGGPLTAKLTTATRPTDKDTLILQAALIGAGGEAFSSFGAGKGLTAKPTPPTFALTTKDGKKIAAGNMEYG